MPLKELENLVRVRKLKEERASPDEISGLLRSGLARLKDAGNTSLSLESRFDLAYNAAHALSLAALRWHGYRSESRYIVFQCLQHTIEQDEQSGKLDELIGCAFPHVRSKIRLRSDHETDVERVLRERVELRNGRHLLELDLDVRIGAPEIADQALLMKPKCYP